MFFSIAGRNKVGIALSKLLLKMTEELTTKKFIKLIKNMSEKLINLILSYDDSPLKNFEKKITELEVKLDYVTICNTMEIAMLKSSVPMINQSLN